MARVLYLIGAPGAGKSTALYGALKDIPFAEEDPYPILHVNYAIPFPPERGTSGYDPRGCQLGGTGAGPFRGVDRLPMNVLPKAIDFMATTLDRAIVAEGDRLACAPFFDAVIAQGHDLRILYFFVSPGIAAERRAHRAKELGRPEQNAGWVKGRETKCARLASFARYADLVEVIDADQPRDQVVTRLREEMVIQWLRGEF